MTVTLYPLGKAATLIGLNRSLTTFLVNDRKIPTHGIGTARALDEDGLEQLRQAAEDYRSKVAAVSA